MARFSEYLDAQYLPGEVYSAGLSEYRSDPQAVSEYIAKKRFKFDSDADDGTYFQRFLALQQNPEALFNRSAKLPTQFKDFMTLSGLGT